MIRIAKMPYIVEDTDRWGRPLGTFSVVDIQGEIAKEMWGKIQEYEGYSLSKEAKEDEAIAKIYVDQAIILGDLNINEFPNLPHMNKLIGYCKSLIWQFNLRVSQSDDLSEAEYIRSYAKFDQKTLHEWTAEHDEKVKMLKEQATKMNA